MQLAEAKQLYREIHKNINEAIVTARKNGDSYTAGKLNGLEDDMQEDLDIVEGIAHFAQCLDVTLVNARHEYECGNNEALAMFIDEVDKLRKLIQETPTLGQIAGMYRAIMLEVMREEVEAFKAGDTITGTRFKMLRKKLEEKEFNDLGMASYKKCLLDVLSFAYESNLPRNQAKIAAYVERLYEMSRIEVL